MNTTALKVQIDDFDEKIERLKQIFEEMKKGVDKWLFEAAHIFKSFGPGQLKQAKKILKPYGITSDRIDCLVLFAEGKMSPHLAFKPKAIPASVFVRLPKTAQDVLNDPEQNVEVVSEAKGVRIKKVRELTSFELAQVADPKQGIRTPEQQKVWLPKPAKGQPKPRKKKNDSPIPTVHIDKIEVDRKDRRYLVLTGHDDDQTEHAMRVKDSMIRKFFK